MAESSKTHHFIPVIIFPSKVTILGTTLDKITVLSLNLVNHRSVFT